MAYRSITSLELGNSRKRRGRTIKKVEAGNLSKYKYLQRFLFSLALTLSFLPVVLLAPTFNTTLVSSSGIMM